MSHFRVAHRYSKSLLELSKEQGVLDETLKDIQQFNTLCKENREFVLMLKNPIIKHDKKNAILKKIFPSASKLTILFFDIICRKNRESILPEIAKEFLIQYNVYKDIERATVKTAIPLTSELRSEIEVLVKKISSKANVELVEEIDKELIGGFVLKVGDRQIDDSIKSKLKALELKFSQNLYIKEF